MNRVLMVGVTGDFAHLVLPELKKRDLKVRALIRKEKSAEEAIQKVADETAVGDLKQEGSLMEALKDVDGVFHLNPAFTPDESEMGMNMVHAAKRAGVRKFVFSSVFHPSVSSLSNHAAKRPVEEALYESGLNFTVLQPAMFMQTVAWDGRRQRRRGASHFPTTRRRLPVMWIIATSRRPQHSL